MVLSRGTIGQLTTRFVFIRKQYGLQTAVGSGSRDGKRKLDVIRRQDKCRTIMPFMPSPSVAVNVHVRLQMKCD